MKTTTLDLETTGLVPNGLSYETDFMQFPYILSAAWKVVVDGNQSQTFEYIVHQEGRIVPPEATKINGITQEMCDASKFNTFTVLLQFMMDAQNSDFIIGHNVYFDTSIVKANVLRLIKLGGITPMAMFNKLSEILHKDKRICTMRAGQKLMKGKYPKLIELYMKLFQEEFNAHNAGADVDACHRCFEELVRLGVIVLPELPQKPAVSEVVVEEETI